MIWKLQEEYHMDYKTAFFMAGEWRVLSPRRIHLMFGEMDDEEFKKRCLGNPSGMLGSRKRTAQTQSSAHTSLRSGHNLVGVFRGRLAL